MVPERELELSMQTLSDVKLPSAGEIVPDSELLSSLSLVRTPRMRGMVPERELSCNPKCLSDVNLPSAGEIVPDSELLPRLR